MRSRPWLSACSLLLLLCSESTCFSAQKHLTPFRRTPPPVAMQPAGGPDFGFVQIVGGARVFSANGAGVLSMGDIAPIGDSPTPGVQAAHNAKEYAVQTTIGIRLGNNATPGSVTLKAWLSAPSAPYQVFLDHVRLSLVPAVIPLQEQSGVSRHLVEVRVPESASTNQEDMKAMILFAVANN